MFFCFHDFEFVAADDTARWVKSDGTHRQILFHYLRCNKCGKRKTDVASRSDKKHQYVVNASFNWVKLELLPTEAIGKEEYFNIHRYSLEVKTKAKVLKLVNKD